MQLSTIYLHTCHTCHTCHILCKHQKIKVHLFKNPRPEPPKTSCFSALAIRLVHCAGGIGRAGHVTKCPANEEIYWNFHPEWDVMHESWEEGIKIWIELLQPQRNEDTRRVRCCRCWCPCSFSGQGANIGEGSPHVTGGWLLDLKINMTTEKSPFFNVSSNGWFASVMLVFKGVSPPKKWTCPPQSWTIFK